MSARGLHNLDELEDRRAAIYNPGSGRDRWRPVPARAHERRRSTGGQASEKIEARTGLSISGGDRRRIGE